MGDLRVQNVPAGGGAARHCPAAAAAVGGGAFGGPGGAEGAVMVNPIVLTAYMH